MPPEVCPETVIERGGWHSHPCGKPIKRNGKCGIHAAADERVARNQAQREANKAEAQVIVDRLAKHGVAAYASYDGQPVVTMAADALADLLDSMAVTR